MFKRRVIPKPKDCLLAQKTGLRFDLRLQHVRRRENPFPRAASVIPSEKNTGTEDAPRKANQSRCD